MSTVTNTTVTNTTVTNVNVDNKQTKNKKTSEPKADKKPRAPKTEKKLEEPVVVQEEPKTDEATVPVEKKARAATLPAKYAKFIQFGFWFLKKLNENSDVPAIDEALFNEKLKLFAEVDEQQTFVQEFFDASKDMNKDIRLLLLQRKRDAAKAAKAEARATAKAEAKAIANAADAPPKKPRAPRQKKEASDDEVVAKKPPTKGKKKVLKSDDAFVNEMVQLANGDTTSTDPTSTDFVPAEQPLETPNVDKPNAEKVDKPPKVQKPKVEKTKVEKPPKVDKPKANKKTDKNKPDDPSDNLQVSILNLNDKQYLIDDNNNVYDFNSHDICGKFDPSTQTLLSL